MAEYTFGEWLQIKINAMYCKWTAGVVFIANYRAEKSWKFRATAFVPSDNYACDIFFCWFGCRVVFICKGIYEYALDIA